MLLVVKSSGRQHVVEVENFDQGVAEVRKMSLAVLQRELSHDEEKSLLETGELIVEHNNDCHDNSYSWTLGICKERTPNDCF